MRTCYPARMRFRSLWRSRCAVVAAIDHGSSLEAELAELKERVAALEEDLRRFKEQFGA